MSQFFIYDYFITTCSRTQAELYKGKLNRWGAVEWKKEYIKIIPRVQGVTTLGLCMMVWIAVNVVYCVHICQHTSRSQACCNLRRIRACALSIFMCQIFYSRCLLLKWQKDFFWLRVNYWVLQFIQPIDSAPHRIWAAKTIRCHVNENVVLLSTRPNNLCFYTPMTYGALVWCIVYMKMKTKSSV